MGMAVFLQIKQMAFMWLLVGNVALALWALGSYARGTVPGPFYFRVVVFFQVLIVLSIVAGLLLIGGGIATNPGHLLYAFLNGLLALARLGWHSRLVGAGRKGALWMAFLALLAVALSARSSVTAR